MHRFMLKDKKLNELTDYIKRFKILKQVKTLPNNKWQTKFYSHSSRHVISFQKN
jgi:hypothetical protein